MANIFTVIKPAKNKGNVPSPTGSLKWDSVPVKKLRDSKPFDINKITIPVKPDNETKVDK